MWSENDAVHSLFRVRRQSDGVWRWLEMFGRFHDDKCDGRRCLVGVVRDVTEQRRAEIAQRDREQRLSLALEAAHAGVWEYDPTTGKNYWDARVYSLLHVSPHEVDPDTFLDFVHEEDRDRVRAGLEAALRPDGGAYSAEFRVVTAGGEERWFSSHGRRVEGDHGARLVGVLQDITQRKRTERARRVTEDRFRAVIDNADVAVYAKDLEGRYVIVNRYVAELVGISPDEMLGKSDASILPRNVAAAFRKNDRLVSESGETMRFEEVMPSEDGDRHFMSIKFPLRGEDGRVYAVGGITSDITDQRRAEASLAESERRSRRAQEAGGVGVWERDLHTGTTVWSDVMWQLFGREPRAGADCETIFRQSLHPDDAARFVERAEASLADDGEEFEVDFRIVLPDGSVRWLQSIGEVIRDEHRRPIAMSGVNMDITERKRYEEHLRTVMAELNHRVKNTVAVIQAIAQQTIRRSNDLPAFAKSFQERLSSIATAHGLLTATDWEGVALRMIVRTELGPRLAFPKQLAVEGPDLELRPKQALAMHMAVHELATNATKHGALRDERGRLAIRWKQVRDGAQAGVELTWEESTPGDTSRETARESSDERGGAGEIGKAHV